MTSHNVMDIWDDESANIEIEVDRGEDPYIHISRDLALDEKLSHKTLGAFIRLLALEDNQIVSREQIKLLLGFGRKAMDTFFKELKSGGYLTVKKIPPRPGIPFFTYRYHIKAFKESPVQTRYTLGDTREAESKNPQFRLDTPFGCLDPNNNIASIDDTNTSEISQSDKKDESSIGKPTNQQAQPKAQPEDQTMDRKKSGRERLEEHLSQAMAHEYMFCSMEEAQEATEKIMELFLHTKKRQDPQHQRTLINPKIDELYGYAMECMKEFPKTERTPHDAVMGAVGQFHGRMHQENFDFIASCWVDDHMDLLKKTIHESIQSGQVNSWSRWSRK